MLRAHAGGRGRRGGCPRAAAHRAGAATATGRLGSAPLLLSLFLCRREHCAWLSVALSRAHRVHRAWIVAARVGEMTVTRARARATGQTPLPLEAVARLWLRSRPPLQSPRSRRQPVQPRAAVIEAREVRSVHGDGALGSWSSSPCVWAPQSERTAPNGADRSPQRHHRSSRRTDGSQPLSQHCTRKMRRWCDGWSGSTMIRDPCAWSRRPLFLWPARSAAAQGLPDAANTVAAIEPSCTSYLFNAHANLSDR